jgi:hypothetical protein
MIKTLDSLGWRLRNDAWDLYETTFREVNALAVQRHLMYRAEFDDVMGDDRVRKYLALDNAGNLAGLATFTNDLYSMPLISPDYFARRWPAEFGDRTIWYCGFVGVHPDRQHSGVFAELVETMWRDAAGGLICLDLCRENGEFRRMERVIPLMLHRLAGPGEATRMDTQTFWLYQYPGPTEVDTEDAAPAGVAGTAA